MEENLVLALFVLVSLALVVGLYFFFVKFRRHQALRWRSLWLILGNLLVFAFLLSLFVLGGELYYRYRYDTTESFGLARVTQRWFQRHFHMNASGFRDTEDFLASPPPGKRRIVLLGDSFTAGHGVDEVENCFSHLLKHDKPDYQILAVAQCGWDTGQELQLLKSSNFKDFEFDVLVLVYCLNDIADISPRWQDILQGIYAGPPPGFLVEHSWFLNTYYYRLKGISNPTIANYYQFVLDAYDGPLWNEQQHRLMEIHQLARARGARMAVVTFPFIHALGPDYPYARVHKKLDQFWREQGVPQLDLWDTYKSYTPAELRVNPYDAHPNERAHAIAAAAISKFLDEEVLKP